MIEAATPRGSSVAWFGCSRTASRPGRPRELRKALVDLELAPDRDQVLVAHQLGDRRRHLRRDAGRDSAQPLGVRVVGEQPLAEGADRQVRDVGEGDGVVGVDDQARDLVRLVGDDQVLQEGPERQVGQDVAGDDALLGAACGDAGELVAGAKGRGGREQRLQVLEAVAGPG